MSPALSDDLPPVNRRFATPEEATARLAKIEATTDLVADCSRATEEIGPRDAHPERTLETVPSCSAILIAMAINNLAAAIREQHLPV